ncbi:unnamed protein product [Gordionus sp. m RMFG-2023]|uniref:F-actin-capping protein subunit beta-like n=1 Tax=Gordionus sp. m RMFG-2023 TaxID=3053472 RepID=UPI0030E40139
MDRKLESALDLMRRLPPQQVEKNLSDLIDLVPHLCEELLSSVDQPLKIAKDPTSGKEFLLCDYNRDGDSYRSPWSNTYTPALADGTLPSDKLRELEIVANQAFEVYKEMYFDGGISSVYLWELESQSFAGAILIKKTGTNFQHNMGCWDSIHVIEIQEKPKLQSAKYKLTSTVMLWLQTSKEDSGTVILGGSLTRQMESDAPVPDYTYHIVNMGRIIEEMENKIRNTLNEVYFGKTMDIVNALRNVNKIAIEKDKEALRDDLTSAIKKREAL